MTPEERVAKHHWLQEAIGLDKFLWAVQPAAAEKITEYIGAWTNYIYWDNTLKPAPFLFLWGPFNLGKTEVAKSLVRYFILNLKLPSAEFVYWPAYIKDRLNGNHLEINWDAKMCILDDFDGARPIPESMSTWMLQDMLAILKPRGELLRLPTILITNRRPGELEKFFATSAAGKESDDTKHSARQLMSAISRSTFGSVEFKNPSRDFARKPEVSSADHNDMLRRLAAVQDMREFEFYYPEKYGIEVRF